MSTGRVEALVEEIRPAAAEDAGDAADEDAVSSPWSRGFVDLNTRSPSFRRSALAREAV
ncbi:hypothetical protein [Sorangium sp. So ce426]|uniref:hypothetical protein n=1 Tax=unclassified Sorangium TaxID=2621164 RepID=UPI003F5B6084